MGFYREDRRAFSPPLGYCSGNPPETSRRQSLQKRPSAKRACRGHHVLFCARLRHAAGTQWGSKKPMNTKRLEAVIGDGPLQVDFMHARVCKPKCEKNLTLPALPFFSSTSPLQKQSAHCITGPQKRTAGRPEMMGRPAALFALGGRLQQEQYSPMRFNTNNDVKLKVSARKYDRAERDRRAPVFHRPGGKRVPLLGLSTKYRSRNNHGN